MIQANDNMISYHIYFIIYIISHILFIVNSGDAIHPPPKEVGVFLLKMINAMNNITVAEIPPSAPKAPPFKIALLSGELVIKNVSSEPVPLTLIPKRFP